MLLRAILDGAHGFAGPLIVHVDVGAHAGIGRVLLLVRIEAIVVVLVLARNVIGQFVELEALAAHLVLVDRRAERGEDGVPVCFTSSIGTCHCEIVISRLIGMMKALGKIKLVTRTCAVASLIWRSVISRKP